MPVVSLNAGSLGVLLKVPVDEGLIVELRWYNTLTAKPNLPPLSDSAGGGSVTSATSRGHG